MGRNGKIEARSRAELWQRTELAGTSLGITYAIVASGARETVRAQGEGRMGQEGSGRRKGGGVEQPPGRTQPHKVHSQEAVSFMHRLPVSPFLLFSPSSPFSRSAWLLNYRASLLLFGDSKFAKQN